MTAQFSTIFLLLSSRKKLYQSSRSIRLTIKAIFCFAVFSNFNHSLVIAIDIARTDKVNHILRCKPTVSQYISPLLMRALSYQLKAQSSLQSIL